MTFIELGLSREILKAMEKLGFKTPTPIQNKIIPYLLSDKGDLIGLAQTGTGKTAAFGIPILERINLLDRCIQSLILCPTRELCLQISNDLQDIGKNFDNLKISAIYGGTGYEKQIKALKRGIHVVVATPGRLLDLIHRGVTDFNRIKYLIIDEADIMLNMGFKKELNAILESVPAERRTILMSATMAPDVRRLASLYMRRPAEITVGKKNTGVTTVEHKYFIVHARDKYKALKRIIDFYPEMYGIIFCRTKVSAREIAEKIHRDGYTSDAIHGDLSQEQREHVMRRFRSGKIQLLVATDIAARGLDVNNLTHIIHYDLPDETDVYTHRSGRTGRAGKSGASLAIINIRERHRIRRIENKIGREIKETLVPRGSDICTSRLMHFVDRIKNTQVNKAQLAPYLSIIEEKLRSLDRQTLVENFISLEINRFLKYYNDQKDLEFTTDSMKTGPTRKRRIKNAGFSRRRKVKVRISATCDSEITSEKSHMSKSYYTGRSTDIV